MRIITKLLDVLKMDSSKESKSNSISEYNISEEQTIYFQNGKMYKVFPTDKEGWYDARYLVSDGILYDLENTKSLKTIPIPNFKKNNLFEGYGITGSLEYVLKMKARFLREKGKIKESNTIYQRIHLFIGASDHGYREKDYFVYPLILLREFKFEEAEKKRAEIEQYLKTLKVHDGTLGFYTFKRDLMKKTINDCKIYCTDYIEMNAHYACCEKCNKLQGRVYSISGQSKVFPKLPEVIKETGQVHDGCRHQFRPYIYTATGENTLYDKMGNKVDAIRSSNRPYIDDRDEEEKRKYNIYLQKMESEKYWWQNELEKQKKRYIEKMEYKQICEKLPDLAPKSFSGYMRMKKSETKNFLKIAQAAKDIGIEIDIPHRDSTDI